MSSLDDMASLLAFIVFMGVIVKGIVDVTSLYRLRVAEYMVSERATKLAYEAMELLKEGREASLEVPEGYYVVIIGYRIIDGKLVKNVKFSEGDTVSDSELLTILFAVLNDTLVKIEVYRKR